MSFPPARATRARRFTRVSAAGVPGESKRTEPQSSGGTAMCRATMFAVVMGLVSSACGGGSSQQMTPTKTYYFITHAATSNTFWAPVLKGFTDAAAEHKVTGVFVGAPQAEGTAHMPGAIADAVKAGASGIAITIAD